MPWVKDTKSQKPRTVYHAPPEAHPILRVIYDPTVAVGQGQWIIQYAYLQNPSDTLPNIEALMWF